MKYDGLLVALYVLALAVIVIELFSMVALTVVIVLLILILAVQRAGLGKVIKKLESERDKRLDDILARVENVSKKTDNFKEDLNRQVVFVDNKVADVRHFVETEIQGVYNELSRKLADAEDRLNDLRQTFSAAIGSLDERLQSTEEKEGREEQESETL